MLVIRKFDGIVIDTWIVLVKFEKDFENLILLSKLSNRRLKIEM